MKQIGTLMIVLCLSLGLQGQSLNFDKQWLTGSFGKFVIDFNSGTAKADTLKNNIVSNQYFTQGHSSICDSNGRLLLFTNGFTLFDSTGTIVMGGDTLVSPLLFVQTYGFSGFTQTSMFLPMGNGIYYLIIPNATDNVYANWYTIPDGYGTFFNQLLLYKIDLTGNNGLPKVVLKDTILNEVKMIRTMMMACKHANGKDWWLCKQMKDSSNIFIGIQPQVKNKIAKILISATSISAPVYQDFPGTYMPYFEQTGQAMFNCDGTMYAATARGLNKVFLANFDRSTGVFSNPQFIDVPNPIPEDSATQGVCFSPNSQFLYVAKLGNILQYDLLDSDTATQWYHVGSIDTSALAWFNKYATIYPGPDNKVYVGNHAGGGRSMTYIDSPSIKGVGCGWRPKGLHFPSTSFGLSGAPCAPFYDMDLVPCDTTVSHGTPDAVRDVWAQQLGLSVYPNPATNQLYIKLRGLHQNYSYEVLSIEGKRLGQGTLTPQVDISHLHSGVYVLRVYNEQGTVAYKVVKE